MQGIVQVLITRPQLDPIPFRKRHIQAVNGLPWGFAI